MRYWFNSFYTAVSAAASANIVTLDVVDGVATATYTAISGEKNKPPIIDDVIVTSDGAFEDGATLTATVTGTINGPFTVGTHLYQWYRLSAVQGATPVEIAGATNQTYVLQTPADVGQWIVCKARYVQVGGANTMSEWLYSDITEQIQPASDGDIDHNWEDFFDIESGVSVPANWNDSGVSPSLVNLGTGANWTTVEATKPVFSTNKLVFTNAHRVVGTTTTFPPVWEVWIKGRFTGVGILLGLGNNAMFAMDASNEYQVTGMTDQAGNLTEHVFRIVYNGAASKFQVDNGAVITFDEAATTGSTLVLGQANNGSNPGDFEIKRLQRTQDSVLLTTEEVAAKWVFHGF